MMIELSPFCPRLCPSASGKKARSFALIYQGNTPEQAKINLENCLACGDPYAAMSPDPLMIKDLICALHRANEKMVFSMSGISLDDPEELLSGIQRKQFERLFIIAMEHDPFHRPLSQNRILTGACVAFDIITLCELTAIKIPPIALIISSGTAEWLPLARSLDHFRPSFEKYGVRIIDEQDMVESPKILLK